MSEHPTQKCTRNFLWSNGLGSSFPTQIAKVGRFHQGKVGGEEGHLVVSWEHHDLEKTKL